MQYIYHCIPLWCIHVCQTIVLLLLWWILCCWFSILLIRPAGVIWSRSGDPLCAGTGGIVQPIYLPSLENGIVLLESTMLVGWCVRCGWYFQWSIPDCLFLFLLRLGNYWCNLFRYPHIPWAGMLAMILFVYTSLGMYCYLRGALLNLIVFGTRVFHINWGDLRYVVGGIEEYYLFSVTL